MTTEIQTMPSAQNALEQKFSRYRSVREPATKPQILPMATQASSSSRNDSVQRSMSRYRKRSSKSDPANSPPVPQQTTTPTRPPQSHSASLAALTGEAYPEGPESTRSTTKQDAKTRQRQRPNSKTMTSPTKGKAPQSPLARHAPHLEQPPQPRQISWEAIRAARGKVQSIQKPAHKDFSETMVGEDEHVRRLQAQQAAYREAKLERRRAVAVEEGSCQEDVDAEQQERNMADLLRQEQSRRARRPRHEDQRGAINDRVTSSKTGSIDLKGAVLSDRC